MIFYNKEAIYSFKFKVEIKKEIKMKVVYFKRGKKVVENFYAERTTNPYKIAIPQKYFKDLKSVDNGSFSGVIKTGDYFMGKCEVLLDEAEQIYNGIGIVTVHNKE